MARVFIIIGFCALIFFELGSVSALPAPWHIIALTPLALIAFVVAGFGREVWALALLAGLIFDSFAVFPSGTFIIIMLFFVVLVRLLVSRWFTVRSWLSTATLLVVSMANFYLLIIIFRGALMLFSQNPIIMITLPDALWTILIGTFASTVVGLAARGAATMIRYFFGHRFFIFHATPLSR